MGECLPLSAVRDGPANVPAPLRTFTELLRAAADACVERPEVALPVLGEWCNALAPFEPSLASFAKSAPGREAHLPPAAARDRLFAALRACLTTLSIDKPLVLLLDDLQWADELTLSFLSSLGPSFFERHPLLVVGAYRAEERSPDLARLVEGEGVIRLRLGLLKMDEIRNIVGDMLGETTPPPGVVEEVLGVSEGNPYFAAEYLRVLAADGVMFRSDGRWQSSGSIEERGSASRVETLEAIIERRLTFVSAEVRSVLRGAAVIGRTFDLDWLSVVVERTPEVLRGLLEQAREREIVERMPTGYRFLHDKLRQVAYEATDSERRALHEKAARARECLPIGEGNVYERAALIAFHFRAAGIFDRAFGYLVTAGEAAMASFAYRESISLLQSALDLRASIGKDDPVQEARLRRQIADAFQGLGDLEASETHLRAAAHCLGLPIPRGGLGLAAALARQVLAQIVHRLRGAVESRDKPHDARLEEAARVYDRLQQVNFYRGEGLPIFFCGVSTLNVAERIAPSAELATAYANAHAVAGVVPLRGLCETYLQKALDALDERPDPVVESYLMTLTGVYRIGLGQWAEAERALLVARRLAEELGFRRRFEEVAGALGERHFLRGDLDEAICLSREQFESGARGDPQTQCWGLLGRAQALLARDEHELARKDVDRAIVLSSSLGRPEQIWAYGLAGLCALRAGDLPEAVQFADLAAVKISEAPPVAHYCLAGYAAVSEIRLAVFARTKDASARGLASRACRAERAAARIFPIAFPPYALHQGVYLLLAGHERQAREFWRKARKSARDLEMPREIVLAESALHRTRRGQRERDGDGHETRASANGASANGASANGVPVPRIPPWWP